MFFGAAPGACYSEEIFEEYAYFSSYSDSWLAHAKAYVSAISKRLALNDRSLVVEVASNDGYLLQYFKAMGIPVLGVEPAKNVAQVAIEKGIPSVTAFFGRNLAHKLAREGKRADLLVGNNVLAHVPDINDFVAGIEILLKPGGIVTMEFPHLIPPRGREPIRYHLPRALFPISRSRRSSRFLPPTVLCFSRLRN